MLTFKLFIRKLFFSLPVTLLSFVTWATVNVSSCDVKGDFYCLPFAGYSTVLHDIDIYIDPVAPASALMLNDYFYILPDMQLPLSFMESDDGSLFVLTSNFFTNGIDVLLIQESEQGMKAEILDLQSPVQLHVFRNAYFFNGHIYLVSFDPRVRSHYLSKIDPWLSKQENVADVYTIAIEFDGGSELDDNIFISHGNDNLYICKSNLCYWLPPYDDALQISGSIRLGDHIELVELHNDDDKIKALVRTLYPSMQQFSWFEPDTWFMREFSYALYDFSNDSFTHQSRFVSRKPSLIDLKGRLSLFTSPRIEEDAISAFLNDIYANNHGLLNLGDGNLHGRIAWVQAAYLNAFISIIAYPELFPCYAPIRERIKRRVDIELQLLDTLLSHRFNGLSSTRYTYDNQPAILAVHTGIVLHMLKRYLSLLDNTVSLENYNNFKSDAESLHNHLETFSYADSLPDTMNAPATFLMWPYASNFYLDGVGLPYNQQNAWAMGVAAYTDKAEVASFAHEAAIDIVRFFAETELPATRNWREYSWSYWWGYPLIGWAEADEISSNRPIFNANHASAGLGYRTLDSRALLTVAHTAPELINPELLDYFSMGVQLGALELSLIEELYPYDIVPSIKYEVAHHYMRASNAIEISQSIWARRALMQD